MELFEAIHSLRDLALLLGLSTTRVAVAFLLLPVFAPETVPALVRNAIFLAMGMLTVALQPAVPVEHFTTSQWIGLFAKESMLGLALGFGLAAFLWAFEAAGQIVDTKISVGNTQLTDPMSGQQVSVSGALMGRLATFMFMMGGGMLLFVGTVVESFHAWPLAQMSIVPRQAAVPVFEHHLADLMTLAFLIAAPALVVMFAVDMSLGLVNRYAPQLNVIAISMSIKGVAGTAIWMLLLATLADGFTQLLAKRIAAILPTLARTFSGG
ncbi:type III secretion system export apparatus subunit SctT [Piscinibacter terrae]|uniref:EscT/YscT/HrcT family type III secretion system export apparatus protein n=1 Tax=Piscinibacter terrae TaxID=2496871 RepID=A0A3N7HGY1_9BURK|nr:type III secretion system export apparatus subunit SctT [Albitalea terrae]RQP21277.1 EscT/YscT/HrcT family type III secretion system export apparatus protein [Albitalea terrae]